MTPYVPPGMLPFSTVLARLAEAWMREGWEAAPADERDVLEGETLNNWRYRQALRPGSVAAETYARLRPMLADGRMHAWLRSDAGAPHLIPADAWLGRGADRLTALLAGNVGFMLHSVIERGEVLVAEDALVAMLEGRVLPVPVAGLVEPVQAPEMKRANPGGRPKSHDDVAFVIIAARIAFEGQHGNQARLMAAALEAYAATLPARVEPPSEAWARRLVRRLWNGLDLERTDDRRQG